MTSRVLNEVVDTDPQSITVPYFGFIDHRRRHHIFFFHTGPPRLSQGYDQISMAGYGVMAMGINTRFF